MLDKALASLSLALLLSACTTPARPSARAPKVPGASDAKQAAMALAAETENDGPPRFVPDLAVTRFPEGTTMVLSEVRGSVVLLDVWATWCAPCVEALPAYDALAKRFAKQGLLVYALSLDEDPRQVAKFVADTGVKLPILIDDQDQQMSRALKVRGVPTTYLIDRDGTIRAVHGGFDPETLPDLAKQIEQLLAEPR